MGKRRKKGNAPRAPVSPELAAARAQKKAQRRAIKKEKKARQRAALGGAALNSLGDMLGGTEIGSGIAGATGLDLSKLGDTAAGLYLGYQGYGATGQPGSGLPQMPGDSLPPPGPSKEANGPFAWFENLPTMGKAAVVGGAVYVSAKLLK